MLATYCKFKGADFCVGTMMVTVAFEPKMMNARAARTRITTLTETIAIMRLFLRPGVKLARLLAGGDVAAPDALMWLLFSLARSCGLNTAGRGVAIRPG